MPLCAYVWLGLGVLSVTPSPKSHVHPASVVPSGAYPSELKLSDSPALNGRANAEMAKRETGGVLWMCTMANDVPTAPRLSVTLSVTFCGPGRGNGWGGGGRAVG